MRIEKATRNAADSLIDQSPCRLRPEPTHLNLLQMVRNLVAHRAEFVTVMYGPPQDCKGKVWARRQVCGNVFGLWVEIISPGHDEFRYVPILTSRSVVGDHYRYQVEGTLL
jgi:hypothetical protein